MKGEIQGTFADISEDYAAFVEKFRPKKTTDDCYTPGNIYECVAAWVVRRYGVARECFVRPFWPGGDYEAFAYPDGCIVVDNPPFSIISRIVRWYNAHDVDYFLFCPGLVFTAGGGKCNNVCTGTSITFENGAKVNVGFVTSLGEYIVESAPDLARELRRIDSQNQKAQTKQVRKVRFPDEVLTRAQANYLATHGVKFAVRRDEAAYTHDLDTYHCFGACFLLSERKARAKAEAFLLSERKARAKAEAETVRLSDREMAIVEYLEMKTGNQNELELA